MGKVVIEEVELFKGVVGELNKKFIAFDTETTGFSPYKDRIIELGAVLFINNKDELTRYYDEAYNRAVTKVMDDEYVGITFDNLDRINEFLNEDGKIKTLAM